MQEILNHLREQLQNLTKPFAGPHYKGGIVLVSLLFSLMIYIYVVDFYGQDFSILESLRFGERSYRFYSGNPRLGYYQVGQRLEHNHPQNIFITNVETQGSYDNAYNIIRDARPALGLAQKGMIKDAVIDEQIEFVAPIYFDRMHIIYRKEVLNKMDGGSPKQPIEISSNTSRQILELFANASINIGPVGSGSKILSSFIIDALNKQMDAADPPIPRTGQRAYTKDFGEAIEGLAAGELDIGFFMTGCITKDMQAALKGAAGLVGIAPAMVNLINKETQLDLKVTNFQGDYQFGDQQQNTTLGDYSYLIADKRIPAGDIMEIMRRLQDTEVTCANGSNLLGDFPFYESYQKRAQDKRVRSLRNILLFVTTVGTSFYLAFVYLSYFVSSARQTSYLKEIKTATLSIPNNTELEGQADSADKMLLAPVIAADQIPIVNAIILGIKELIKIRQKLNDETGLNDKHFSFIHDRIDRIMEKLRKSLFLRLNELRERGELLELGMTKERIREYFTADWITYDAYRNLTEDR